MKISVGLVLCSSMLCRSRAVVVYLCLLHVLLPTLADSVLTANEHGNGTTSYTAPTSHDEQKTTLPVADTAHTTGIKVEAVDDANMTSMTTDQRVTGVRSNFTFTTAALPMNTTTGSTTVVNVTSSLTSASMTPGNQTTTVERDVNVTGTMTTGREATDMTSAPPGEWTSDISVPTTISRPITKLDVTTSLSTTLTRRMTSPTSHKPTDYAESKTSVAAIIAIVILLILFVLVASAGVVFYVRFYCQRPLPQRTLATVRSPKQKAVRLSTFHPVRSKPVKSAEFHSYVTDLERDSGLLFAVQYEELKFVGRDQSWDDAELQCNRPKNRFTNILPYDRTRVKLLPLDDDDGSDYINANWIPGYSSKREFIATQGPLPSTKDDFWRMVWEYNCQAVVMLTLCAENGRMKCDQYWPADSEPLFYGDLQVKILNENISTDWHVREMHISLGEQARRVKHFHYIKWPDMKVPDKLSMLTFVQLVRSYVDDRKGCPIIVHCSAGVGRTGTFIAMDVLIQQLQNEDAVDIFAAVYQMRMSRVLTVQTEQQYVFIHECIKHILNEQQNELSMRQNENVVFVNALDMESPTSDVTSTENIEDSLSDEGIEDELSVDVR